MKRLWTRISRKCKSDHEEVIPKSFRKAVPALVAGVAFFLAGCQGQSVVKAPAEPVASKKAQEAFAAAGSHLEKDELAEAFQACESFIRDNPEDERVPSALDRMAGIAMQQGRYQEAHDLYLKVAEEHPGYDKMAVVRFGLISSLYRIGRYEDARDEAVKWLELYPGHDLRKDVQIALGMSYSALGETSQAFRWWLKTKEESGDDQDRKADLGRKIDMLITGSSLEDLLKLAPYAGGTEYAPRIFYRTALLYLEQDQLDKAREAAMEMVRSSPEQEWSTAGRELLERIEAEQSVKRGVLGCLIPMSGPFAIYGQEVLNGIQTGLGTFNQSERGGPDLQLAIRDSGGDPEKAVAALEDLALNEKVMAVIGPLSSKAAVAASKRAQELGVPIITLTQKEGIAEEGPMVFRNFLTPSTEVKKVLTEAFGRLGLRRFAILYPDNSYGRFFMNLFWDRLDELGGEVAAVESYDPAETDFADPIKKMVGLYYPRPKTEDSNEKGKKEALPPIVDFDAIFIPDSSQKIAMIAPQLVYHDVKGVRLLGTSLWQSPQLIDATGDYVQGAVFPSGFFSDDSDPAVQSFVEEYRLDFEGEPGLLAATGYDTIRLLREVVSDGDVRTRGDFRKALLRIPGFHGVTGIISFDDQGEVTKEPSLITVSGKRFEKLQ